MTDESIIVSYSEVVKWQSCKRSWYYRYQLDRKPAEESNAIDTGVKGHELLQTYYSAIQEGMLHSEAYFVTHEKAKRMMTQAMEFDKLDFNLATAWTMVDNYIRTLDLTSHISLVENRFLLPVAKMVDDEFGEMKDVQIGFTPDVVFERKGGFIDVEDSKFIQRAWPEKKIVRFPQVKLYMLFLEYMGYKISRGRIRFFNVKTGKISTHDFTMNTKEKQILINDFLQGVAEIVEYKQGIRSNDLPRTMNYNSCQFCPYATLVCQPEAEGKNVDKVLQTQFVSSDYNYSV